MKILFVVPPWRTSDAIYKRLFPMPLAAVLLGTILEKQGHSVTIKDFLTPFQTHKTPSPESFKNKSAPPYVHYGQPMDYCKKWLNNNYKKFDVIGLCTCQCTVWETVVELGKYIKDELKMPLVLGGPHVTTNPDFFKEKISPDVMVIGEGENVVEQAFKEAINHKTKDTIIIQGTIVDITKLPLPNWKLVNLAEYPNPFSNGYRGVISVSRGCPWDCEFCSVYQIFGKKVRKQSKERVREEILNLYNDGVRFFTFIDDNLFITEQSVENVIGTIEELKKEIKGFDKCKFYNEEGIEIRVAAKPGIIKRIHNAGFKWIAFGLETVNSKRWVEMKKPFNEKDVEMTIINCKEINLIPRLFYILGLPNDTYKSICTDLVQLAKIGFAIRPNNLKLYPNQKMTLRFLENGWIDKDYDFRLSSWYTPKSGNLDYKEIKQLKSVLRAIGEAAEEYEINIISDTWGEIQRKFKNKNYIITKNNNQITIKGNMFSCGVLKHILELLALRLGYPGVDVVLHDKDKKLVATFLNDPKNRLQKELFDALIEDGVTSRQSVTNKGLSKFIE